MLHTSRVHAIGIYTNRHCIMSVRCDGLLSWSILFRRQPYLIDMFIKAEDRQSAISMKVYNSPLNRVANTTPLYLDIRLALLSVDVIGAGVWRSIPLITDYFIFCLLQVTWRQSDKIHASISHFMHRVKQSRFNAREDHPWADFLAGLSVVDFEVQNVSFVPDIGISDRANKTV